MRRQGGTGGGRGRIPVKGVRVSSLKSLLQEGRDLQSRKDEDPAIEKKKCLPSCRT